MILLGQILNFAVRHGLLQQNVTTGLRKNRGRRMTRFLSADELARLYRAMDAHAAEYPDDNRRCGHDIIRLLILTGCGKGKILNLIIGRDDNGNAVETIRGTSANDRIDGGAGNNHLYGNAGNDHLYGGTDTDSINGGAGNDHLYGGAGKDVPTGGAGRDTFNIQDTATSHNYADLITDFSGHVRDGDKIDIGRVAGTVWIRRLNTDNNGTIDTVLYDNSTGNGGVYGIFLDYDAALTSDDVVRYFSDGVVVSEII